MQAIQKGIVVRHVTPLQADGSHELFEGERDDTQARVFLKNNVFRSPLKGALAPLNGTLRAVEARLFPTLDRFQNVTEVVLSHVLKDNPDVFDFPVVACDEALYTDPVTEQPRLGVAAPWLDSIETLEDRPAESIVNSRQAVEGTLVSGILLGNWDVTFHRSNTVVVAQDGFASNGDRLGAGQFILNDLGCAGYPRIEQLGVPFGSNAVLHAFPEYIDEAAHKILSLTDDQIGCLVQTSGSRHINGWTDAMASYYSSVLIHNRNALSRHLAADPTWLHPGANPLRATGHDSRKQALLAVLQIADLASLTTHGVLALFPPSATVVQSLLTPFPSERTNLTPAASPR